MLERLWSMRNSYSPLVGIWNGMATLKGSLENFHKAKHILTYDLVTAHLGIYLREVKSFIHTKICTRIVYSIFIYNIKIGRKHCVPQEINGYIDKYIVVHLYNGILFWKKKERKKEMNYQARKKDNRETMPISKWKKRLHAVWFQLYDNLEKAKLWRQ